MNDAETLKSWLKAAADAVHAKTDAERIEELEAMLHELVVWRATGEAPSRLWARARDLLRKPERQ